MSILTFISEKRFISKYFSFNKTEKFKYDFISDYEKVKPSVIPCMCDFIYSKLFPLSPWSKLFTEIGRLCFHAISILFLIFMIFLTS